MRRGRRREAVGWYLKFAAACGCPDPDQVVAHLVDESARPLVIVKFLPDEERELAPELNLDHLDFAVAVMLINTLRTGPLRPVSSGPLEVSGYLDSRFTRARMG